MSLKQGDYVVIHSLPEADGEILECASNEFLHTDNGNEYNAVTLKNRQGIYNVSYLQKVNTEQFLKKWLYVYGKSVSKEMPSIFVRNKVKPETIEMQNYIYDLLSKNPSGMYAKDILEKMKKEKSMVYSNITVLMNRLMKEHPEIKKPYHGFYIIES
ncbi:hypothetical protein OQZ55_00075 [Bacillus subtilis]|uniref:Rok-like winged helix domain-containing protein n=1 Tax=Bacillus subtilis TaxID=1423 RepID=UPI002259B490|nr:hypothetical protein [Bacillus subtilis]MCX4074711.1 hypothetical protein [Bacillus subtilis]MEC0396312.1 hypothetical protein [Bacillus subtilis]